MRQSFVSAGLLASALGPLVAVLVLAGQPLPTPIANLAFAVLMLFAVGFAVLVLRSVRGAQTISLTITQSRQRDVELLSLLGSQMVPVMLAVFGRDDRMRQAAMVMYLVILAVVYVRGRLVYLNPVLAVLGFHIWELERENGQLVRMLSRTDFVPQQTRLLCHRIAPGVYLECNGARAGPRPAEHTTSL